MVRCVHCGLVYVSNPPATAELEALYSFRSGYHLAFRDNASEHEKYFRLARQNYRFIKKYRTKGRLLDIGCSAGFFLKVARDLDWETHGLEISEDAAAIAKEKYGLGVAVGSLQESTFTPDYFDVVTLWDVLEHLADPRKTLSIVNRILKGDGIVVISTPNIDGVFPKLSYQVANIFNCWPHPEPPYHLFQFSKKTLNSLLNLTDFELVEIYDERIPVGYTFGSLKKLLRSPKRLVYSILFAPVAWVGSILKAGDSMIAIARKSQ